MTCSNCYDKGKIIAHVGTIMERLMLCPYCSRPYKYITLLNNMQPTIDNATEYYEVEYDGLIYHEQNKELAQEILPILADLAEDFDAWMQVHQPKLRDVYFAALHLGSVGNSSEFYDVCDDVEAISMSLRALFNYLEYLDARGCMELIQN